MHQTSPGCFLQRLRSSLTGLSMERDHMKDLRRYLVLKYIQYLVLSSSNAVSTCLGLLGSSYTAILLQSAKVSAKSTAVFISSLAKADLLVAISLLSEVAAWSSGGWSPALPAALLQNLLTANAHVSCLLLSCVAFEAYLITFLPAESRRVRTVRNARLVARAIWTLVAAECILLHTDDLFKAGGTWVERFRFSSGAADLLRSLSYVLGVLLRVVNVYIYYKIFFSLSHRSALKHK